MSLFGAAADRHTTGGRPTRWVSGDSSPPNWPATTPTNSPPRLP